MISSDEFTAVWRWGDLKKYNYSLMKSINIPEEAKIFLSEAGLPSRFCLFSPRIFVVQLDTGSNGNPLCFMANIAISPRLRAFAAWERLPLKVIENRSDNPELFCIEEITGAIYYADIDTNGIRFINSSLPQYAESLVVFAALLETLNADADIEYELVESVTSEAKHRLVTLDPIALNVSESFWNLMLRDIYISY